MIAQLLINVWNNLALKTLFFRNMISRRKFVIFLCWWNYGRLPKNGRDTYHLATSIMFFLAVSLIAPIHEQEYKKLRFTKPAIPLFSLIWFIALLFETLATFCSAYKGLVERLRLKSIVERIENYENNRGLPQSPYRLFLHTRKSQFA